MKRACSTTDFPACDPEARAQQIYTTTFKVPPFSSLRVPRGGMRDYEEKWEYVRNNPTRAGLAESADGWKYQGEVTQLRCD